jgi:hypothetical protein
VERRAIRLAENDHGGNTHFAARAQNANGNFSAICYQNLFEHLNIEKAPRGILARRRASHLNPNEGEVLSLEAEPQDRGRSFEREIRLFRGAEALWTWCSSVDCVKRNVSHLRAITASHVQQGALEGRASSCKFNSNFDGDWFAGEPKSKGRGWTIDDSLQGLSAARL